LPPSSTGQSYDIQSVTPKPAAQPVRTADQGEEPDRAYPMLERFLDLVIGRGGIDRQVAVSPGPQRPDRLGRGVHVLEGREYAGPAPDPLLSAISGALP
jgi:hypothetical protein